MDSLDVMQAVDADIPSEYPDGNAWLEETLENAPPGSITLMWVAGVTPLQELFTKKPYLADKVKRMVWMAGAIDVPGNLEPACDSFRCAPYLRPTQPSPRRNVHIPPAQTPSAHIIHVLFTW